MANIARDLYQRRSSSNALLCTGYSSSIQVLAYHQAPESLLPNYLNEGIVLEIRFIFASVVGGKPSSLPSNDNNNGRDLSYTSHIDVVVFGVSLWHVCDVYSRFQNDDADCDMPCCSGFLTILNAALKTDLARIAVCQRGGQRASELVASDGCHVCGRSVFHKLKVCRTMRVDSAY